jgi:hypothetical protein
VDRQNDKKERLAKGFSKERENITDGQTDKERGSKICT